jgi:hypothetical protein
VRAPDGVHFPLAGHYFAIGAGSLAVAAARLGVDPRLSRRTAHDHPELQFGDVREARHALRAALEGILAV